MWREFISFALEIFRLKERFDDHDSQIKDLQGEVRRLTDTVIRLELRMESQAEHERQEREKLVLMLDNALLRFDRRLPKESDPPPSLGSGETG
jgi:hypothetical protein